MPLILIAIAALQLTASAPVARPKEAPARGPSAALAREMAETAVAACAAFPVAVAILDSAGLPKLYYVPDGTVGRMADFAARKARVALRYRTASSVQTARAADDPAFAGALRNEPDLLARPGAVPLMAGDALIGAIGVGGAPRSEDDEACAVKAVAAVHARLR